MLEFIAIQEVRQSLILVNCLTTFSSLVIDLQKTSFGTQKLL